MPQYLTPPQDKSINKRCIRITGPVAATTFLAIPGTATGDLQLTGRYLYLQLRCLARQSMTLHLEAVTADSRRVRAALSTLYTAPRATASSSSSSGIRCPLQFELGARATEWSVVAVDLRALFAPATTAAAPYTHLKGVRLCSNMVLRAAIVSDELYDETCLPKVIILVMSALSTQDLKIVCLPARLHKRKHVI
jgi:Protein of unknown function (DUF667)